MNTDFDTWFFNNRLPQIRYMMLFTAPLYILYGFVEYRMELHMPELRVFFHALFVPAMLIIILGMTYVPSFIMMMKTLLFISPICAVFGNLYFNVGTEVFDYFVPEIYLNIIWTVAMSGLSIRLGITAVLINIFMTLVFHYFQEFPHPYMFLYCLWMLSSAIFGVVTAVVFRQVNYAIFNQQQKLAEIADTDNLTHLWNRNAMQRFFHKSYQAQHLPISVMMIDLDYFKQVNDQFGHIVGDSLLVEFAQLLQENVRRSDYVGRFGGEEFCVVMPNTQLTQAQTVAESLLAIIHHHQFRHVERITASFGVAQMLPAESFEGVLSRADQALYLAKSDGRNNVKICLPDAAVYA